MIDIHEQQLEYADRVEAYANKWMPSIRQGLMDGSGDALAGFMEDMVSEYREASKIVVYASAEARIKYVNSLMNDIGALMSVRIGIPQGHSIFKSDAFAKYMERHVELKGGDT